MDSDILTDIVAYLTKLQTSGNNVPLSEALDVTLPVLTENLKINANDLKSRPYSLEQIYAAGVEALRKRPSTATSVLAFDHFISKLKEQGFFQGCSEGSDEYASRVQKAKEKFEQRFGPTTAAAVTVEPDEKAKKEAESMKEQGNRLFSDGKYELAAKFYSQALQLNPKNAVYYSNRAAAYIYLKNYQSAIDDSQQAIALDPKYSKAYSRLAQAHFQLERYEEAVSAFESALRFSDRSSDRSTTEQQLQAARERLAERTNGHSSSCSGLPNLGGMNLEGLMNNPMVQGLMNSSKGPDGQLDLGSLMRNPMVQGILGSSQGADGNIDVGKLMSNPVVSSLLQNPAIAQIMQSAAGQSAAAPGSAGTDSAAASADAPPNTQ